METLTDAGPLVALVDQGQAQHTACVEALSDVSMPLLTTLPCFTEAMYLLGVRAGTKAQAQLWKMFNLARLQVHSTSDDEIKRMQSLMNKYGDVPMSLADASLVATAETRQLRRIFTLDSDFRVYRANDKEPFEVVP